MTFRTVTVNPIAAVQRSSQSSYLVMTTDGLIYSIFCSQIDNSIYFVQSGDEGFSWSIPVLVKALGGVNSGFGVWYDRWTPGDTGTKIHIWFFDQANDDVGYRSLDTADDSLGTEVVVFAGGTTGTAANTCISGTKAIGGNLYVAFDIDGGTETGFYRSVDAGANWTARTDVNEAISDYYFLAPGFALDTNDIICIFWDRSASEISRKVYDNSGDSWAESSIATSMTAIGSSTCSPQFSILVDDTNNKVLLVAWSNRATLNADLRFWSIDESTITEGTNVVLNSGGNQQMCTLGLNTGSNILYCFYGGKSDGSESAGTSINIYYKISSDFGVTWGSETPITGSGRNYDYLMTFPLFISTLGVVFQAQATTIDNLLYAATLPESGNNVAAPVLGDYILQ